MTTSTTARVLLASALALGCPRQAARPSPSAAPVPLADSAAFVVRVGVDTVALERYVRRGGRIEGQLVTRVPRTRRTHFALDLAPDGTVTGFASGEVGLDGGALQGRPAARTVVAIGADSAETRAWRGDSLTTTTRAAAPRGTVPFVHPFYSFTTHELAIAQGLAAARAAGVDSVRADLYQPGARATYTTYVRRHGPDSAALGHAGGALRARVDARGRALGFDFNETTIKAVAERVPWVELDRLAAEFAARDAAGRPLGSLSPRDTVRATVPGGAALWVDYGRPMRRGRQIFGAVVPWGQVWRAGADAATQLRTDRALLLPTGERIPAGTYTRWIIPAEGGTAAQLVVNKQTGQWGTQYDAKQDLLRVPLTTSTIAAPVDRFTIEIEPRGSGGVLRFAWENTRFELAFEVGG